MRELIVFLLAIAGSPLFASDFRRVETLEDVHAASFRVTVKGARGTATFIGVDERGAIFLTNYHVVSNNRDATVEGWGNYDRGALPARVDWRAYDARAPYDFAELVVDPETLKRVYDPPFVPLAGEDCDVADAKIVSAGAPRGAHVVAWKGRETGKYNGQTVMFTPPPAPGQSGSLLVAKIDGELWGVAVLTWLFGAEGDDSAQGGAIPISNYYRARGVGSPASFPGLPPIPENAVEVAARPLLKVYTSNDCEPCARLEPTIAALEKAGANVARVDALGSGADEARRAGVDRLPTAFVYDAAGTIIRRFEPEELASTSARDDLLDAYKLALKTKPERAPVVEVASSNGIVDESLERWRSRRRDAEPDPTDGGVFKKAPGSNDLDRLASRWSRRFFWLLVLAVVCGQWIGDGLKAFVSGLFRRVAACLARLRLVLATLKDASDQNSPPAC